MKQHRKPAEPLKTIGPHRAVSFDNDAELPLVTIAWRALRAEYQQRAEERRRAEAEARRGRAVLARIAEETYWLQQTITALLPNLTAAGQENAAQQLLTISARLVEALAQAEVNIVAPEGEPYTAELMRLLTNVAQRPDPATLEPRVAEVLAPAITQRHALLQRGKAVIAVPVAPPESATGESVAISEELAAADVAPNASEPPDEAGADGQENQP